ncbi:MAG TPA: gfo/Idh/MocA family oxidoreductase, partial [Candidatus Nesterenkonia stercoripullorum]|nr:gfo/Idh/MocA family oxidoreductase [Candidatus Nesterenkonia stercoripullorum]
ARVLAHDAARLCAVPAGHPMGYIDAFANFVRDTYAAIQGAAPEGLPRFADGARANQLIDAVLESARTRQWVDLDDVTQVAPIGP